MSYRSSLCDSDIWTVFLTSCIMKVKVTQSCPTLCDPTDCSPPGPLSRQEYWSELPFPSPGDLPDPGIEPWSPALQADSLPIELLGKPLYYDTASSFEQGLDFWNWLALGMLKSGWIICDNLNNKHNWQNGFWGQARWLLQTVSLEGAESADRLEHKLVVLGIQRGGFSQYLVQSEWGIVKRVILVGRGYLKELLLQLALIEWLLWVRYAVGQEPCCPLPNEHASFRRQCVERSQN